MSVRTVAGMVVPLALVVQLAQFVSAQPPQQVITQLTPEPENGFGFSVAFAGPDIVVGGPGSGTGATTTGECEVYRWASGGYAFLISLDRKNPLNAELFGRSLCSSDSRIAVGAPRDSSPSLGGAVQVYARTGSSWTPEEEVQLASPFATPNAEFGFSVALSGDVMLVGARTFDVVATPAFADGAAFVFRWNGVTWVQEQMLTSPAPFTNHWFGYSVAVVGELAVVSGLAPPATVFRFDPLLGSWLPDGQLAPPLAPGSLRTGAVAIQGNCVFLGAPGDDTAAADAGAVYVYEKVNGAWIEIERLTANDGAVGDELGISLAVDNDVLVVGARYGDGAVADTGAVYFFRRMGDQWLQSGKIFAADGQLDDWFGTGLALRDGVAAVGVPCDTQFGPVSGSVYVYDLMPAAFVRSDSNADGSVNIADAVSTLTLLFGISGPMSTCEDACDSNDDGLVNIADPVHTLGVLFSAFPSPAPPFPGCGDDLTPDSLWCLDFAPCP